METVLLYTIPNTGHLFSMVELAKKLLSLNSSLSITIIHPNFPNSIPPNTSSITSSYPSISFHSFPTIPLLKDPSNYSKFEEILFETIYNNHPNIQHFIQSLSLTSSISAIILDFFCFPTLEFSQSLHIPTYFYLTSGASALSFFLNLPSFDKVATDSYRNLGSTLFEIPSLFHVPADHMIEPMLDHGIIYDELVKIGAYMPRSDGIIINTFEALEPRVVKALKENTCVDGTITIPPVYCIGPLIAKKEEEKHECLTWLDSQPARSVVLLSFGSTGLFSEEQTREIAIGLEKSEVSFLWVVRAPRNEDKPNQSSEPLELDLSALLPNGFVDRTKDRGFIVKSWAPQWAILAHEAIGGFVTHCGWNSTLEAVYNGLPMVAWPLYAEQKFNKIVLVEELKIALPMDELEDGFVSSDEIERRVKEMMMSSMEGESIRKRVMDFSHEAKVALDEGGSSQMVLTSFMKSWKIKDNKSKGL